MSNISLGGKVGVPVVQAVITDPVAFTPIVSAGFGTITAVAFQWRRVGSSMHISGKLTAGTTSATSATFAIPLGLTAASSILGTGVYTVGKWGRATASANAAKQGVVNATGGSNVLGFSRDDYTGVDNPGAVTLNVNTFLASGDPLLFDGEIIVPILEWAGQATVAYGAGQATTTRRGLVFDRKQYIAGTAYTNGTPTIISGQPGFTNIRTVFSPYQTVDGAWRLTVNGVATFTSASVALVAAQITGVTFKTLAGYDQAFTGWFGTNQAACRCYVSNGTGNINVGTPTAATATGIFYTIDVELDSKPTWAD